MGDSVWHVTVGGQAQGPFTLEEVVARLGRDLGPDTLVWNPSLSGWLPVSGVPELAARLSAARPAPAPPAPAAPRPPRPAAPAPAAANPYSPPQRSTGQARAQVTGEEPTLNPFALIGRAFRWRGKFNRGEFAMLWFGVAVINAVFLGLAFAVLLFGGSAVAGPRGAAVGAIVFWIVCALDGLAAVFVNIGALVRRLNDLGKPSWWLIGAFIPLLGLVLILYLLFAPGDPAAEIPDSFGGVWIALGVLFLLFLVMIAIVAALAIPGLLRARTQANEAAAIGDVRSLISAQVAYSSQNGGGYEGRFECLTAPSNGCIPGYSGPTFLWDGFTTGPRHGYVLELHGGSAMSGPQMSPSSVASFVVVTSPVEPGKTGVRLFCGDQTGVVCSATGVRADDLVQRQNGDVSCSSVCSPL